jgi:hypothetical protein
VNPIVPSTAGFYEKGDGSSAQATSFGGLIFRWRILKVKSEGMTKIINATSKAPPRNPRELQRKYEAPPLVPIVIHL